MGFNPVLWFARKPPPVARKAQTGTSFDAKGIIPPTKGTDVEGGSSQPVVIQEVVPALASPFARLTTYSKMMNDAGVDVSMRVAKTPILGADFFVDPYSSDPRDVEIAEFIWDNLAGGMNAPFLNSLEDILHMYEDGYSIVEKVYEQREWSPKRAYANTRNYTMLKKLGIRPASTIKEITYDDNGGPVEAVQNAIQADRSIKETKMPVTKIMVFTFGRKGGDLTGKSLLRTAYPHWYYKTHMYKIDSIQKERHSLGVPKGKLLPGYTPQDKETLRTLLRNIRTNEEGFIMESPTVEISFEQVASRELPDVLNSAAHHNVMIMMNVLGQFISLGLDGGGGRATASTQSDLFMKSLKYVAKLICDQINMYLIPELVVWNYPTKRFPQLKVRNIGETRDLQMLGAALANLFAQQALTSDEGTEAWIREVFDMPAKTGPSTTSNNGSVSTGQQDNVVSISTPQKGDVKQSPGNAGNLGKPANAPQ